MSTCKIIIRDEVNCKLEGLELDTRRKLVKKFEYEVPYARHMPSVKLGRWNGKVSFFQLGGSTYINLLEEIIPIVVGDGYEIELDDQRDYHHDLAFEHIEEDTFKSVLWPQGHPHEGQPIMLRDYQVEVINSFLENPQSMQEVATGAGKTLITAALSRSVEHLGRSIVIVPNKSLVTQTEKDYVNMGLDVGVYFGDRKEYGRTHTICTWQSLANMMKNTQAGTAEVTISEMLEGVIAIVIDEAHGAKADMLKTMLTGVMSTIPIRWGLTGTIPKEKFESQALFVSIGNVINKLSASELQDRGVLAQCHVNVLQLQDDREFTNYQSELKFLLEDSARLKYIAGRAEEMRLTGNTLILVDRISAGTALADLIRDAVFVNGGTKSQERQDHYDEVSETDDKVIVATYGVAAVGINIPRIFNLVLVEPGKSFVRVIQSIGRGIRKAEDKDFVQIWDMTSSCRFAKRHLTKRKQFYTEANYPYSVNKAHY